MKKTRSLGLLLKSLAAFSALLGVLEACEAADHVVTNLNDSGPGSLRAAIVDANSSFGADTINFDPKVFGVITLTSGELIITGDVTIVGPGADLIRLDGNNASRVLRITLGPEVSISGLTFQNGNAAFGGGIVVFSGTLLLSSCIIAANRATEGAGMSILGGSVRLDACVVRNNLDRSEGGGINVSDGDLTLVECSIVNNGSEETNFGGGLVTAPNTTLNAERCLIAFNAAFLGGGGARIEGSGTLTNCTIWDNEANLRGGGLLVESDETVTIAYCTVAENESHDGAGLLADFGSHPRINGTIFAGNNDAGGADLSGSVQSLGFNLIEDPGFSGGWVSSDILFVSALLGSLGDHGGPTQSVNLSILSPAIDSAGHVAFPLTDQRGVPRFGGTAPDRGAFEVNEFPVAAAGPDQTVECTGPLTSVTLDGSASSDPENAVLIYEWFENGVLIATGSNPTVSLAHGSHTITLRVEDPSGLSDEDDVVVEVEDTTAPVITEVAVDPAELWPGNHKMKKVAVDYSVSDACDPNVTTWLTVTSSEADSGLGTDDEPGDIVIHSPHMLQLRAERYSTSGRTYTITIHALDAHGNESTATITVRVPWRRR